MAAILSPPLTVAAHRQYCNNIPHRCTKRNVPKGQAEGRAPSYARAGSLRATLNEMRPERAGYTESEVWLREAKESVSWSAQ